MFQVIPPLCPFFLLFSCVLSPEPVRSPKVPRTFARVEVKGGIVLTQDNTEATTKEREKVHRTQEEKDGEEKGEERERPKKTKD